MTGILVIDKPQGFTSFDVVAKVRRICKEKKCGHSGTLDPMATGVMTVLLGGATRFCELLPSHNKAYEATFKLGITTDTLDITGKVISQSEVKASAEDVISAADGFKGVISQIPPMYSAVSVGGKRLYDLARQGIEVERAERQVTVSALDFLECNENDNEYKIFVECSGGTYIRTLISDIGEKLGCGAVMTALKRVKANNFTAEQSITLDELQKRADDNALGDILIPVDISMNSYPEITVSGAQSKRFSNGGELMLERVQNCEAKGLYRVYSPEHLFLGLGENDGTALQVKRVYVER